MLGLPKAAASMASGEFLDTSLLGRISDIVDMTPFSRLQRVNTYKTWGSLFNLLPKGGNALWGDSDAPAPDDYSYTDACGGFMLGSTTPLTTDKTHSGEGLPSRVMPNVTVDEMITEFLPTQFPSMQHHLSNLSFGYSVTPTDNNDAVFKWANPLEVALPNAPEMTMYSIYGEGSYTERSYAYQARDYDESSEDLKYHINFTKSSGRWTAGVCLTTRGDGTVPLTSLGYMSATQWRKPSHNPHGVKIVTVELPHKPHTLYLRGGDYSCGHVDIMGNRDVNRKLLNIVSGGVEQEAFTSSIREIGDVIYDRLQKSVANRAVPNESEKLRKKAQADERDHARAEHIELKTNDIREDL